VSSCLNAAKLAFNGSRLGREVGEPDRVEGVAGSHGATFTGRCARCPPV